MSSTFKSSWITAQELKNNFYMKVKKTFMIDNFNSASIKVTADDYYKLYVNGEYVGQGPAPSYNFAYNYNEYDITKFLKTGENVVEAVVYYQGLVNRVFVSGDSRQGMIADIFVDGKYLFGTDESWEYCIDNTFIESKTVGYDTAYLENRDLRIPDSEFKSCVEIDADYTFCQEPFPSLQVYSVKNEPEIRKNSYFYDFGQEYVCNLKIKASSEFDGGKIIIRCGEELDENGNVRYKMRCSCDYEEICILKQGENSFEQYDYKAFRYVEIVANDGISVDSVELLVRHYPFPENSWEINTDDEVLQSVFELCKNTIKYGTQEVFVDCPTREKGQYLGDVLISGFAHLILTKDNRILRKAIENFAQSMDFCGELLSVAPCSYKQKIADYSLLFPYIVRKYYEYTQDKEFLAKMLPICERINSYFGKFADSDGLLTQVNEQWNLVDWPEGCRDNYDFELSDPIGKGKHNVLNAFYIGSITCEENIKNILNIEYEKKSESLKRSFNNVFFEESTGLYVDSEMSNHSAIHSNMLPLVFDICEDENKDKIADYLVARGMQCGVYMAYFYLKALCRANRKSEAYNTIISKGEKSWYNMIKEGATTCFEAWGKDKKWNTSLFHPWATAPIIILYEDLI